MKFPELKWDVPVVGKDVTRTVLDNGLILYLMEDREDHWSDLRCNTLMKTSR